MDLRPEKRRRRDLSEGDLAVVLGGGDAPLREVRVHSVLLALVSPVWRAMLESDMCESREWRVELPGKSADEFELFMRFVNPATLLDAEITPDNVEVLVRWFDEYQMDSLRAKCVSLLLDLPLTGPRLQVAWSLQITEVREMYMTKLDKDMVDHCRVVMELQDCPEVLSALMPHFLKQIEKGAQRYEDLKGLMKALPYKLYKQIPGKATDSKARECLDRLVDEIWELGY